MRPRLVPLVLALAGCAHGAGTGPARPSPAAPTAAAPRIDSDEEFAAARAEYEARELSDPARAPGRDALLDYLVRQLRRALDGNHLDEASNAVRAALSLWDPSELGAATPPRSPRLLAAVVDAERAFRGRGRHGDVLLTLAAQRSLGDPAAVQSAERRYRELEDWLLHTEVADGETDGQEMLLDDLEIASSLWPSPFVVDTLGALYLKRGVAAELFPREGRRRRPGSSIAELLLPSRRQLALDLARLYLRVGRLADLEKMLEKAGSGDDTRRVLTLVHRAAAPDAQAGDILSLAQLFARESGREADREVGLRICKEGARRFPKAVEPRLCVGEFAAELGQLGVALSAFEGARTLAPDRADVWETLVRLSLVRLSQVASDENIDVPAMEKQVQRVTDVLGEANRRFPDKTKTSVTAVLYEVGHSYYNAGRPDDAIRFLERSIANEPSPRALELLGQLRLKRGQPREAVALLERAIQVGHPSEDNRLYLRAKARRHLADAFEAAGEAETAQQMRRDAVEDWDKFVLLDLTKEYRAEAQIERGKLLYAIGDRAAALDSLRQGIDAAPEIAGNYADIIAFLVPRGELDEALDHYHRALGRNEITDYLKVYCSLWVIDLARRAGAPEDPLALAYLKSTDGARWYADLARWATGRETDAQLVAHADTPGRKAEAAFYRSLRALGAGDNDKAKALWKEVVASDMMAFFEYDMAQLYLKLGRAPTRPLADGKATAPARPTVPRRPTAPKRPDGSI